MKIGLYFGTFNPIHIGHLTIANHLAEHSDLNQVWFVVTPHSPFKKKSTLLKDNHRYQMVDRATENYPKLRVSDIEFKLPQPNYTINTLTYLEEKYPDNEFCLIMGKDNLNSFHKWKNYERILERYRKEAEALLEEQTEVGNLRPIEFDYLCDPIATVSKCLTHRGTSNINHEQTRSI